MRGERSVKRGGRTPPRFRRYLTDQEILETIARFSIDARRSGRDGLWFYNDHSQRERNGWPITGPQVIEFLDSRRFEGERSLRIYCNVGDESRLGVAYTSKGVREQRARAQWKRIVGTPVGLDPSIPRRKPRRS